VTIQASPDTYGSGLLCFLMKAVTSPPQLEHTTSFTYSPFLESLRTTSDTSNIFMGRGIFLLAAMVFRMPGNSVVLAI